MDMESRLNELPPDAFSGLETEGMKVCRCTLKFQKNWEYTPRIKTLEPKPVTVDVDGSRNQHVHFNGCKVIQIDARPLPERVLMPLTFTIGGPCRYTKGDKRDFEVMMRTKEQSLMMKLPPNGDFDWPDYRAFETCPFCWKRAKPGSNDRYWLLFHNMGQFTSDGSRPVLGTRFVYRLTCEDCFEEMIEGMHVQCRVERSGSVEEVPLLEVVENQGPVTWLRDPYGDMIHDLSNGKCMDAYRLYCTWEFLGACKVLYEDFSDKFREMIMTRSGYSFEFDRSETKKPDNPSEYWEMSQIPDNKGRQCDGPSCQHVHGDRKEPKQGEKKGKKIRLEYCTGCFEAMYCSEQCHHLAWSEHKVICKEIQQTRKEEEEKKRAEKEAAVLNSFIPVSIDQMGGGKKKKGRKSGGKKKKGKK